MKRWLLVCSDEDGFTVKIRSTPPTFSNLEDESLLIIELFAPAAPINVTVLSLLESEPDHADS